MQNEKFLLCTNQFFIYKGISLFVNIEKKTKCMVPGRQMQDMRPKVGPYQLFTTCFTILTKELLKDLNIQFEIIC